MSTIAVNAITDANGGSTTSINGTTPNAYNTVGKNLFINGSMSIDQRNSGSAITVASSSSGYPVDRFKVVNQTDGQLSAQQSTTAPAGFTNSLYTTVTTVDSSLGSIQYAQISQRIEGNNLSHLDWGTSDAKTVTISFWVRSSLTGDYGVGVYNYNGSYCYFSDVTINTADTWEKKTITITGPTSGTWYTDNLLGLEFHISLGTGSSYQGTADAWTTSSFIVASSNQANWIGTSGATFYLTGVQLEVGESATEFEHRPYTTELSLCERYYQTGVAGSPARYSDGYSTSPANYRQKMRASPTVTVLAGTAISGYYLATQDGHVSYASVGTNNLASYSFSAAAEL
jgi:hypothetical protein